jgi:hypothetical protein
MKKFNTNQWFVIATIFAFLGFISFFNIDSAIADEKNLNTPFTIGGIAGVLLCAVSLKKAKNVSNNIEG